jgi:hypothetical protein
LDQEPMRRMLLRPTPCQQQFGQCSDGPFGLDKAH